ncbi:MAG TPA: 50S ribosomal protein L9 [Phycisphaerales bacterium]|nr:50S ribosomal protein L9 [Phycisphaerales bacterium]HMP36601.1 50S ribosomal protein L9 [Phycisphaerales bacterium]
MARSIELLLLRNIENLGIVGDLVKVRPGHARNFLLPHALAEFPTPEKIESLKDARAKALAEVAKARSDREELLARMTEVSVSVVRSCNDQGILYGSISQRDIADALQAAGYGVDVRAVRLSQSIRRIGSYHVPVQLDKDLRTEITIEVKPDRQLEQEMREAAAEPEAKESGGEAGQPEAAGAKERTRKPAGATA